MLSKFKHSKISLALLVGVLSLWLGWHFASSGLNFFTEANLKVIFCEALALYILSLGLFFLVILGKIDVSLGGMMLLAGLVFSWSLKHNLPLGQALSLTLLLGGVLGSVNALLIGYLALPALLVTLAMLFFFKLLALWLTTGYIYADVPVLWLAFALSPLATWPLAKITLLALLLSCLVLLFWRFSVYGRRCYAIGLAPETALLSGISVRSYYILSYILAGLLAALALLILTLRLEFIPRATSNIDLDYQFAALLSVFAVKSSLKQRVQSIVLLIGIAFLLASLHVLWQSLNLPDVAWTLLLVGAFLGYLLSHKLTESPDPLNF